MAVVLSNSIHVIACGVLAVDIRETVRQLGMEVTLEFLPGGLHARPLELKRRLQERIGAPVHYYLPEAARPTVRGENGSSLNPNC
jgi:hypothetical protein